MEYFEDFDEFIDDAQWSYYRSPYRRDDDRETQQRGRQRDQGREREQGRDWEQSRGRDQGGQELRHAADGKQVERKQWRLSDSTDLYGREITEKAPKTAPALDDDEDEDLKALAQMGSKFDFKRERKQPEPKYEPKYEPKNEPKKPRLSLITVSHPQKPDKPQEQIASSVRLVQKLETALETPKKIEDRRIVPEKQQILSFAVTLHRGLKFLWLPMVCLGRLPFRLLLQDNIATIVVRKGHPAYIACFATCVFTWLIFAWITLGISILIMTSGEKYEDSLTLQVSPVLAKRHYSDVFIFWTTLLQACMSTTHILSQAEDLAMFIKEWYRVLDMSKIEVSRTLKKYIIVHEVIIGLFLLAMLIMFFLPFLFPHFQGTAWVIVICLGHPIIAIFGMTDKQTRSDNGEGQFYFETFAGVGFFVYLLAIIFSWMYIIQFMVFCRCFRKGLKSLNNRLAMILNVDDVLTVGPNAVRLTYEHIHKDYLSISTTGSKIGRIYSWTMCNYYLWAILVLVFELGEIFIFAKRDYRKNTPDELATSTLFEKAKLDSIKKLPPIQVVINSLLHLMITTVCIFMVSHEGAGAHKEGKISYELARYRGLIDCTTQLERNFIRSIWVIVSEKCPVHVSPGKYFGVTHSTVMTVFATAFTYFIFWVQSQGQLQGIVQKN